MTLFTHSSTHFLVLFSSAVLLAGCPPNAENNDDAGIPIAQNGTLQQIAAGSNHTCIRGAEQEVLCRGWNISGQLGDGSFDDRTSSLAVSGLNNVDFLSGGYAHTCALLDDGTVQCWGNNEEGQLGDGSDGIGNESTTPVNVLNVSDVLSLSAGTFHTCALLRDGTAKCWGGNENGQMGDGSTEDRPTAVGVNGLSGVLALTSGDTHTCALLDDGTAKCWGSNDYRQLGEVMFTEADRVTPVSVFDVAGAISLTAGYGHTCAVLDDGTVKCWGSNVDGRLGDGSTELRTAPVQVQGIFSALSISAGSGHTCALLDDGRVSCWGKNEAGQLGDGTFTSSASPVMVSNLTGAVALTAGEDFSCALLDDGTARCWGLNSSGQLGDGTRESRNLPVTWN